MKNRFFKSFSSFFRVFGNVFLLIHKNKFCLVFFYYFMSWKVSKFSFCHDLFPYNERNRKRIKIKKKCCGNFFFYFFYIEVLKSISSLKVDDKINFQLVVPQTAYFFITSIRMWIKSHFIKDVN